MGVAYEFDQTGQPGPDSSRNPSFLTQDIAGLTAGATYKLGYSLTFDACTPDTGFVGARIANIAATFDACDRAQAAVGKFFRNEVTFTVSPSQIFFEVPMSLDSAGCSGTVRGSGLKIN